MSMFPATTKRVSMHTTECANEAIRRRTEERIARCAAAGREAIDRRLTELDAEWDIERVLEANAATASLVGVLFGATGNRKWFMLPAAVGAFLLQHAVEGWCPPLPIFRRLGFRTQSEIDYERYALKSLRGDFENLPKRGDANGVAARQLIDAMRR